MNNKLINWGIFILLCFIWGSSFILMKESKKGLLAGQIAALRIFAAGVVFLPFAIFHIARLPRKKMGMIILIGLSGNLLPAFCYAIAILKTDSALAGILNSLTPICVASIGIFFFRDKIKAQKIIGILIGFTGLCLLILTQGRVSFENAGYASLIIAATLMYGINVNLVAHYLKDLNPVHLATVSLSFMAVPAAIVLWQDGFFRLDFSDSMVQWAVINAGILGIVGSALATIIFYMLVQRAGGLFASLVTYGIPFVALFWGMMDGENITFIEVTGLLIILAGVYLANRPYRKTQQADAFKDKFDVEKQ